MTNEQFDALVARLERQAERHPAAYKFKLGAFATLGYVYIFSVLLVLLTVTAALVVAIATGKGTLLLKLVIPIVVLIGVVVKSLWVKLEAPQGLRLMRDDHMRLFQAIDDIRRAARAPRAHEVLLTNELNASIVQVARLGMFGWQKNYLILGLPLLQLLSTEEFKAVLAHEFGHLSGAHGRFGAWIYRIRLGWARLSNTLQQSEHWGRFLFVPFFEWYAPTFAAYSFVQARQQEYEADRVAAMSIGALPLAHALVRLNLKGEDLQSDYWPTIFKAADEHPAPVAAPFRGLLNAESRGFLPQAPEQLRQALERKTSTADTHPSLRDRLATLAQHIGVPPAVGASAAEELLTDKLASLVEHFDTQWQATVAEWWRDRHEHVRAGREKLAALSTQPREQLDDVQLYEYALAVEEFDDPAKAFELYKELVVARGATRGAKFAYARLLLQRGDDSAIRLLEEVMRDLPETTLPACDLIVGYLHEHDRQSEAQPYIDRYVARQQSEHEARMARETIRVKDTYLPHTLSAESLAALQGVLARHRRQVKSAYLVRKELPNGEPPLHVVGVLRRTSMFKFESSAANQQLLNQLASEVGTDDEIVFISLNGAQKTFKKPFNNVAGAQIV
jgi:Zn-dependent protease with chaperone function